jgi:putative hydrolase of the HAD superfamily
MRVCKGVSFINKKYKAIIFDLFGTLIENFRRSEYEEVLAEMAAILDTPFEDFQRVWLESFPQRVTGAHADQRASIEYICQKLKVPVTEAQVEHAFQVRLDYTKRSVVPRACALKTLKKLKEARYKIGLISDCSGEIPLIWDGTPLAPFFDVTVFSCTAGIKKPNPRIYQMATEALKVNPQECLYIGDGSSQELTGALKVGMYPVLINDPTESVDAHYIDREEDWPGPRIASLREVLSLLE